MPSQIKVDEIKNVAGQYEIKTNTFKGQTDAHNITINKSAAVTMILRTGIAPTWSYNNSSASPIDGINISSGTDNGTGDYTFTFSTNMPDSNYVITGSTGRNATPHFSLNSNARASSNFRVSTGSWGSSFSPTNNDSIMLIVCK